MMSKIVKYLNMKILIYLSIYEYSYICSNLPMYKST